MSIRAISNKHSEQVAPSKEELWEELPQEIRNAITEKHLEETEVLLRKYPDEVVVRRWYLKEADFETFAIGRVGDDPFFAYHYLEGGTNYNYTETIHRSPSFRYNKKPVWMWTRHRWGEAHRLFPSAEILTADKSDPAVFLPNKLDRIQQLFQNITPHFKLIRRDGQSVEQGKKLTDKREQDRKYEQEIKNVVSTGSISISMKQGPSSSTVSSQSYPASSSSKQIGKITRCSQCGISNLSGISHVIKFRNPPFPVIFKDPGGKTHTVSKEGRFGLYEKKNGEYEVRYLGKHHHKA